MTAFLLLLLAQADGGVVVEPPSPARASVERTKASEFVDETLDDGRYWRFGSEKNGPVHVWSPRNLKRGAPIVIYLHGFFTDVDAAVREHRLTAQFRDSGRNALFIIPETRSGARDDLLWPELPKLLAEVEKRTKTKAPTGPIVLLGHSGAYKAIAGWLKEPRVTQVLLVDGLYGNEPDFEAWLDVASNQLVLVSFETRLRSEWLVKKRKALELDTLPWLYDELPMSTRTAPLVHIQSERVEHMQLVTEGRLIPWLLHAFR